MVNETISRLIQEYGEAGAPSVAQWQRVFSLPADQAISLVNFFKLREFADYTGNERMTGQAAFDSYAAVSGPALERVGGSFTYFGAFHGMFVGGEEDWDIVVVGSYPNNRALLALFNDPLYKQAYKDRTAACSRQNVSLCLG